MTTPRSAARKLSTRRWIVGLMFTNAAMIAASFSPLLEEGAGYLRAASVAVTLSALGLVLTGLRTALPTRGPDQARNATALVATFVAAALVTMGVVSATDVSEPTAFAVDAGARSTTALPVSLMQFNPSAADVERVLVDAAETAMEFSTVTGRQHSRSVAAAQAAGYAPRAD